MNNPSTRTVATPQSGRVQAGLTAVGGVGHGGIPMALAFADAFLRLPGNGALQRSAGKAAK